LELTPRSSKIVGLARREIVVGCCGYASVSMLGKKGGTAPCPIGVEIDES